MSSGELTRVENESSGLRWIQSWVAKRDLIPTAMPYVILGVLVLWLALLQPASLSWDEVNIMINGAMVLVLLAIGQCFVLICGGIDFSVGGVVSLVSAIAASHMASDTSVATTVLIVLALSWVPGLINGLLVTYAGLQPFIVTLAMWFFWSGIALFVMSSAGGTIDESFGWLSTGSVG
jgi:ribose/xylose/arabinose/galactoside ABC-type transport system permease subunit